MLVKMQMHMAMKHECSGAPKQLSKGLGIRIQGGGSGGQHRCGGSPGNALCLGYVFATIVCRFSGGVYSYWTPRTYPIT